MTCPIPFQGGARSPLYLRQISSPCISLISGEDRRGDQEKFKSERGNLKIRKKDYCNDQVKRTRVGFRKSEISDPLFVQSQVPSDCYVVLSLLGKKQL